MGVTSLLPEPHILDQLWVCLLFTYKLRCFHQLQACSQLHTIKGLWISLTFPSLCRFGGIWVGNHIRWLTTFCLYKQSWVFLLLFLHSLHQLVLCWILCKNASGHFLLYWEAGFLWSLHSLTSLLQGNRTGPAGTGTGEQEGCPGAGH